MIKIKTIKLILIILLSIWMVIIVGLFSSLFYEHTFLVKLILGILSAIFLFLFLFYLKNTWFVYHSESEKLYRLNKDLEIALHEIEKAQIQTNAKEILLNKFIEQAKANKDNSC